MKCGGVADAEDIQIQKGFAKHHDGNIRIACCRVPYGVRGTSVLAMHEFLSCIQRDSREPIRFSLRLENGVPCFCRDCLMDL